MSKLRHNLTAIWAATPFPSLLTDWRHWLAFVAWLGLMFAVQAVCGKSALGYAAMTVVGVALLVVTRSWRFYHPSPSTPVTRHPSLVTLLLAAGAGLAVFAIWVGPEAEWMRQQCPAFWC